MAMATWPSSPPGGTLMSVLLLLLFAFAHVGKTASPNARPACPECGESPASVTTQDPGFVASSNPSRTSKEFVRFTGPADAPNNDAAAIPDEAAGPNTSMVTSPEDQNSPVEMLVPRSTVTKTVRPPCCNQDPEPAPEPVPETTPVPGPCCHQDPEPAPEAETPSIFTTIYVDPLPPMPDSESQAPAPPPLVETSEVVESPAAPPPEPPACCNQPPADPAPSPSSQVPSPQAPSSSTPVAAPPDTTSSSQVPPPTASSMRSQSPPAVAPSVSTQAPAPETSSSSSEVPPPPAPSSSSQMSLPAAPIPSPEKNTAVTSSSSSQAPQETAQSLSDTQPDEATAPQSTETPSMEVTTSSSVVSSPIVATTPVSSGQPESTEAAQPETPGTIASSIGEDEQPTSEAHPPKSSEPQSETPTATPSSATQAAQNTSETPSSTSEEPQPATEVVETQTEHGAEGTSRAPTQSPSSAAQSTATPPVTSTETDTPQDAETTILQSTSVPSPAPSPTQSTKPATQQTGTTPPDPSQEPSQKGTQKEQSPTSTPADSSKSGTTAAKTSGEGKLATTSSTSGPSPSGTAGTTAQANAPSSSAGREPTTDASNIKSSDSSASASSSSPSSTDGCNPNADEDEDDGEHGYSNPLLDIAIPPGAGWLKSAAKVVLEAVGYNPDTGKEDTRPPCPSETGTEDEEEDDDDDDDDINPPPGGVTDTDGKDKKKPKPQGGGGGGGRNWPWPPGPPPPGVIPGPLGGQGPYHRPTPKPSPMPKPGGGVKTDPVPTKPGITQNPVPEPTTPPDPDCTPIVFDAGCVQDCTSFSYTRPNITSTWTECGGEECSLETGCRPTPALTETSWTTRTCSKTITQTDVCKQVCTEHVSPLSSTSAYTTETRCASSVTCRPTVVCEEQEPTTTTSYTTKTEAPTHACYATEEDLEARLMGLEEKAARPGNAAEPGAMQKRQVDEYNLLDFNRLTHSSDLNPNEWYIKWRQVLETKGIGSPHMAFAQYRDDDFLPNHAVYMPLRDIPAGTGIRNMAGCSAVVVASPHGVYVGHFWEIPTFRAPDPGVVPGPLKFNYYDRRATFDRRVTDFIENGNLRWRYDDDGKMVPDPDSPASPSLEDLAKPGGPFHDLKSMEWHYVAFIHPRLYHENRRQGGNFYANEDAWREWRDAIRRTLSPNGAATYFALGSTYKQLSYSSLNNFRRFPQYANVEQYFDEHPGKNALLIQYAPAVPNANNPGGRPSRQFRITFNEKTVFSKTWCAPPAGAMLPLPPNLPDNTGLTFSPPRRPPPGAVRLAARQEGEEPDESEMETLSCPAQPWRVCAVDVAQTVVPTMGPSIQGTIDVTDEQGLRAHIQDFENVPFGGFVSSEPEDNHLGYNVTMRFDGEWDKFLLDKGFACNCTNDGCDMYSAQCCLQNDCPKCNCADGVCPEGSPACCQDNSCNATRPREPTNYPFKAWDVKVAIEGEKGALDDEHAWAKDVSCTTTKWDYLNETVVDGYCMAHRQMRCTWACDQYDDGYESSLEWMETDEDGSEE